MEFIVIDGAEHEITIDSDEGGESIVTAADCPCGDTSWVLERRGYCGENKFAVCESCPNEYKVEWRRDAVSSLRNVSAEYIEVMNLCNAAKDHKRIGCDAKCHTSLYLLGATARRVVTSAPIGEHDELQKLVAETDWL